MVEAVKKPGIPKSGLNPVVAPAIACQGRHCGHALLQPWKAVENAATGQLEILYHCEPCGYDFHGSPQHALGYYTGHAVELKSPPEVMPRPALAAK